MITYIGYEDSKMFQLPKFRKHFHTFVCDGPVKNKKAGNMERLFRLLRSFAVVPDMPTRAPKAHFSQDEDVIFCISATPAEPSLRHLVTMSLTCIYSGHASVFVRLASRMHLYLQHNNPGKTYG